MSIIDQIKHSTPVESKSISVEEIKQVFEDLFYNKFGERKHVLYTTNIGYNYFKFQLKMINFVKRLKRQYKNLDK